METFSYKAVTKEGNVVEGTIDADYERLAVDKLQDMGIFPIKISKPKEESSLQYGLIAIFKGRVRENDVMNFSYQLGVLLEAGFPLDRCLSIVSELTGKKEMSEIIKKIISDVRGGKSFSAALSKFPKVFPAFYINMIKAGETGGFLEETISKLTGYLENSQKIKNDVHSALVYPALLSIVGGAAVVVLLTFVVPKFTKIFSDMGQSLPLPTQILLFFSNAMKNYWWLIAFVLCSAVMSIRSYLKTPSGMRYWDNLKFKFPLFGKLYMEVYVSRFARTLGTLLQSGVPILTALQSVEGVLGSKRITDAISATREAVRKGKKISTTLKEGNIFPPLAVHMITIGEETGKLDGMLFKIADRFDFETRTTIKRLLSLMEPALILFMGLIVGFIVIAMLMAIFSLNELPF
ncbi:MAG: type II secretion system protein GspF [Nitrospira bacterium HGW-Nitrospira-1]|nr:MAG: type II secretion system protein GspF [Nitrospira bacterium HGW-Nitrospira-1]